MGAFYVSASYAAVDMSVATSVDLASSYVFRGATLNKKASIQPAVEMAVGDNFSLELASLPMEKLEGEQSSGGYLPAIASLLVWQVSTLELPSIFIQAMMSITTEKSP